VTTWVHVWLGAWRRPEATSWTGHSALSLDSGLYISYWPSKSESLSPLWKRVKILQWRPHRFSLSIDVDIRKLGRPDHTVAINNLNEKSMEHFWLKVKNGERRQFHSLDHNCSTVVARALGTGHNDAIKEMKRGALIKQIRWLGPSNYFAMVAASISADTLWYPSQVLRYARALAKVMN